MKTTKANNTTAWFSHHPVMKRFRSILFYSSWDLHPAVINNCLLTRPLSVQRRQPVSSKPTSCNIKTAVVINDTQTHGQVQ